MVGSIPRRDLVTEISDILPKKHNTVRFAKNILYDSIFLSFPQNRSSRYSDSSQVIIKYDHNDNLLAFAKAKKLPRIFENRGRKMLYKTGFIEIYIRIYSTGRSYVNPVDSILQTALRVYTGVSESGLPPS